MFLIHVHFHTIFADGIRTGLLSGNEITVCKIGVFLLMVDKTITDTCMDSIMQEIASLYPSLSVICSQRKIRSVSSSDDIIDIELTDNDIHSDLLCYRWVQYETC